jgi:excisionase family DNA binding protein
MRIDTDKLLNVQQAIKQLGISRVTFYDWINRGKIKPVHIGGKTFITVGEMERVVKDEGANKTCRNCNNHTLEGFCAVREIKDMVFRNCGDWTIQDG